MELRAAWRRQLSSILRLPMRRMMRPDVGQSKPVSTASGRHRFWFTTWDKRRLRISLKRRYRNFNIALPSTSEVQLHQEELCSQE